MNRRAKTILRTVIFWSIAVIGMTAFIVALKVGLAREERRQLIVAQWTCQHYGAQMDAAYCEDVMAQKVEAR